MNLFESVQHSRPKSNAFDLSHEVKLSCNMGELIPIFLEEIVPGDKFRVSSEIFLRTVPLLAPIMHRVNVYCHYYFVPNRLIWENWENFITGGESGTDASVMPKLGITEALKSQFAEGSLAEYLGIPVPSVTVTGTHSISALPFRAYQLIYNDYYRDQNLEAKIDIKKTDTVLAAEQIALTTLRLRAYEKDYFTSCLPWAQRGAPVTLPVNSSFSPQYLPTSTVEATAGGAALTASSPIKTSVAVSVPNSLVSTRSGSDVNVTIKNLVDPQVITSTSVTINELRVAVRLQEWLEKNARAGARYIESILAHFGVRSSDARLQRPEYLGGGKQAVQISEVLNTGGDSAESIPQGTMAGHGISVGKSNQFTKSFEEHGYVIGIMSVVPRTAYQQGIPKTFNRFNKLDYFFPEFAHLGEQAVLNKELYNDYNTVTNYNTSTFGYQSRYAEYKYQQSRVAGQFATSLNYWHLGRKFAGPPVLNNTFIKANPVDMQRIFPVSDSSDKLLIQVYNDSKAIRPMPVFGTPTL
ncbi:MAG: major capsid protein [Arizlama microvirus]|nr:MAG: major capsid protein [Arizlama microvirus]